jgi:AhpD family alkylhydroperoxidase
MTEHFYGIEDTKKLSGLREARPETAKAFGEFNAAVFKEGALSVKTKELIAIAAAHMTQCPWCIAAHTRKAKELGATVEEVTEAIWVAAALRAGGSFAHGSIALGVMERK